MEQEKNPAVTRADAALAVWGERLFGTRDHETELGERWNRAQAELDKLRFHPALRRRWREARAEVAVRAAAASATLAGVRIDAERLRTLVLELAAASAPAGADEAARAQLLRDPGLALAFQHWRAWAFTVNEWPQLGSPGAVLQLPYSRLLLSCVALLNDQEIGANAQVKPDVLPAADDPALLVGLTCCEGTQTGVVRAGIVAAQLAQAQRVGAVNLMLAQTVLVTSFVDPTGLALPVAQCARDPLGYRAALRAYQRGQVATWLNYWVEQTLAAVPQAVGLADAVVAGSAGGESARERQGSN